MLTMYWYSLSLISVRILELNLSHVDLQFVPEIGLLFDVQNSSITLSFQRQILYWFLLVLLRNPKVTQVYMFSRRTLTWQFSVPTVPFNNQYIILKLKSDPVCLMMNNVGDDNSSNYVFCQSWHREHQRVCWWREHQHCSESDERWWRTTED